MGVLESGRRGCTYRSLLSNGPQAGLRVVREESLAPCHGLIFLIVALRLMAIHSLGVSMATHQRRVSLHALHSSCGGRIHPW